MTNRVQWTETVSCLGCGEMGKVTLSSASGADDVIGSSAECRASSPKPRSTVSSFVVSNVGVFLD
jgi:hypothetical protein